jgi:hypothetical protein
MKHPTKRQKNQSNISLQMTYICICQCARKKTPRNSFYVFRQQGNLPVFFKTCYIISVLFSTKCYLFDNFIFFCSNNTHVFINHELKFKYKPGHLTVKLRHNDFNCKWETDIKMHIKKYSYNKSIFHIRFVSKLFWTIYLEVLLIRCANRIKVRYIYKHNDPIVN